MSQGNVIAVCMMWCWCSTSPALPWYKSTAHTVKESLLYSTVRMNKLMVLFVCCLLLFSFVAGISLFWPIWFRFLSSKDHHPWSPQVLWAQVWQMPPHLTVSLTLVFLQHAVKHHSVKLAATLFTLHLAHLLNTSRGHTVWLTNTCVSIFYVYKEGHISQNKLHLK